MEQLPNRASDAGQLPSEPKTARDYVDDASDAVHALSRLPLYEHEAWMKKAQEAIDVLELAMARKRAHLHRGWL